MKQDHLMLILGKLINLITFVFIVIYYCDIADFKRRVWNTIQE